MKTRVKTNAVAVMMGLLLFFALTVSVKAGNTEDVKVIMLSGKKVMLQVQNPYMQQMEINITDESNQYLYSSKLPMDAAFRKVYDLSNLPEGNYKVLLQLSNKVLEKDVRIEGGKTAVINESTHYLPYFKKKDNNLMVNYLNTAKDKVSVSFYSNTDKFFSDKPDNATSFQRLYSLEKLEPGQYNIELTSGDKMYSYPFEVQ